MDDFEKSQSLSQMGIYYHRTRQYRQALEVLTEANKCLKRFSKEKCIAGVHPDNVESMEEEESDDDGKSSQFESDDDEEPQVLISELETGVRDEEEESCNDGKLDQERKITEEENISGIKGNSDNKQGICHTEENDKPSTATGDHKQPEVLPTTNNLPTAVRLTMPVSCGLAETFNPVTNPLVSLMGMDSEIHFSYVNPSANSGTQTISMQDLTENNENATKGKSTNKEAVKLKEKAVAITDDIILQCLVKTGSGRLSDVIGLDHVIVSMKKTIFLPLVAEKEFGSDLQGVLLFGPSGVGKTHILSCLVGELNYIKEEKCKTFPTISIWKVEPKDILHKWIGDSDKYLSRIFELAHEKRPSIIIIDEIDSLLCQRKEDDPEHIRRLKTGFLSCMDGLNNYSGIVVVGLTNFPQHLDYAFRRRFSKRIYIGLPDSFARERILAHYLKKTNLLTESFDLGKISSMTEGFSAHDLAVAISKLQALQYTSNFSSDGVNDTVQLMKVGCKPTTLITQEMFEGLIRTDGSTNGATNDEKTLDELKRWGREFGAEGMTQPVYYEGEYEPTLSSCLFEMFCCLFY
ncbi:vacuolar protein sorting-associated protein 4B isoform X2 [Folsomia candida]|uniref:vacuolar protein sorting-associated protein 4B isoform X2 n=1 Tax=Folsomia candida TaxID=158441 RepID=UPI001604D170|nr:vacuolar protein sorting-associated protein 4B isoform X2 [Folsomia candida]